MNEGTEEPPATPLFDSPAHIMWAGVVSVLVVMTLLFFVMMRGRASRGSERTPPKTDFFAPPDDDFAASRDGARRRAVASDYGDARAAEEAVVVRSSGEEDGVHEPRRGLFGGAQKAPRKAPPAADLPVRKDPPRQTPKPRRDERSNRDAEIVDVEPHEPRRLPAHGAGVSQAAAHRPDGAATGRIEHELRRLGERVEERLDRIEASSRRTGDVAGGEDLYGLLSGVEDALAAQSEGLKAETRNLLQDFADALDQRFGDAATLGASGRAAVAGVFADPDASGVLADVDQRFADLENALAVEFDALRNIVEARADDRSVRDLAGEVAALRDALPGGATANAAPRVQLLDAMQRALPASAYQINATIEGRHRADAVIRIAAQRPPIAVDAQFPVEAVEQWRIAQRAAKDDPYAADREARRVEQDLRGAALGHVVGVAERLIRPPRTVDGALLFLPSEDLYAELQIHFPDVLLDAIRARVWIVTPASFTATLNIVRALFHAGPGHDDDPSAARVADALDELKRHVARLEARFDSRPEPRPDLALDTGHPQRSTGLARTGLRDPARDGWRERATTERRSAADGHGMQRPAHAAPLQPAGRPFGETEPQAALEPTPALRKETSAMGKVAAEEAENEQRTPPKHSPNKTDGQSFVDDRKPPAAAHQTAGAVGEPRTYSEPFQSNLWSTQGDLGAGGHLRMDDGDADEELHSRPAESDERRFPLR